MIVRKKDPAIALRCFMTLSINQRAIGGHWLNRPAGRSRLTGECIEGGEGVNLFLRQCRFAVYSRVDSRKDPW
jgi:hypothetical protein